jgi:hypothetical protein
MAAPANVTSFLKSAFNQPETDYLTQQPIFTAAVAKATTFEDCDQLCYTGQKLLNLRTMAYPQLPSLRPRSLTLRRHSPALTRTE